MTLAQLRTLLRHAEAWQMESEPETRAYEQWEEIIVKMRQRVLVREINAGPPHSLVVDDTAS